MPQNQTKQRIFDASVALFSAHGYNDVSVNNIAAQVGISNAAIYRHFESKEAILNAIFDMLRQKLDRYCLKKAQVDRCIETDTPRQLLARCVIRFAESDSAFMTNAYRIVFREHLTNPVADDIIKSQMHEAAAASVKYALDSLIARGMIRPIDTWSFSVLWAQCLFSSAAVGSPQLSGNALPEQTNAAINPIFERLIEMAVTGKVP